MDRCSLSNQVPDHAQMYVSLKGECNFKNVLQQKKKTFTLLTFLSGHLLQVSLHTFKDFEVHTHTLTQTYTHMHTVVNI